MIARRVDRMVALRDLKAKAHALVGQPTDDRFPKVPLALFVELLDVLALSREVPPDPNDPAPEPGHPAEEC